MWERLDTKRKRLEIMHVQTIWKHAGTMGKHVDNESVHVETPR